MTISFTGDICCYSREAIEATKPHIEAQHLIISISSGHKAPSVRLPICKTTVAVLPLVFSDLIDADARNAFTKEQAKDVWDFLDRYDGQYNRILIHCDAGLSRSPAMAFAINEVVLGRKTDFGRAAHKPNPLVYRLMLEEGLKHKEKKAAMQDNHAGIKTRIHDIEVHTFRKGQWWLTILSSDNGVQPNVALTREYAMALEHHKNSCLHAYDHKTLL
jgi:predicted protein tyrosine phosphatase